MPRRPNPLPPEPFPFAPEPTPLADAAALRALLVAAAAAGEVLTYSDALARLGHRFTRPAMRQLCRTLGQVDLARAPGEPELAVLVVRASDRLPGAGWWADAGAPAQSGPDAERFVRERQRAAFRHWRAG